MTFVADFSTDGADARSLNELAGVAVVPMLVGKLTLSLSESTELGI